MQPWPFDIRKVSGEVPSGLRRIKPLKKQSTISVQE